MPSVPGLRCRKAAHPQWGFYSSSQPKFVKDSWPFGSLACNPGSLSEKGSQKKKKIILETDLSAGPHSITLSLTAPGPALPLEEGVTRQGDFYCFLNFYQEVTVITRDDCASIYTTADWSLRKDETKAPEPKEQALSRTREWPQHSECQAPMSRGMPSKAHASRVPFIQWHLGEERPNLAHGIGTVTEHSFEPPVKTPQWRIS